MSHYEVEVTPDPSEGPVFRPVHSGDSMVPAKQRPVPYQSRADADLVAAMLRTHAAKMGVKGYQARVVLVDGDRRAILESQA